MTQIVQLSRKFAKPRSWWSIRSGGRLVDRKGHPDNRGNTPDPAEASADHQKCCHQVLEPLSIPRQWLLNSHQHREHGNTDALRCTADRNRIILGFHEIVDLMNMHL